MNHDPNWNEKQAMTHEQHTALRMVSGASDCDDGRSEEFHVYVVWRNFAGDFMSREQFLDAVIRCRGTKPETREAASWLQEHPDFFSLLTERLV